MADDVLPLDVTCLCAEWCGVCRDYAAAFDQVAAEFGARCRFGWLDIEDEAELLDGIEVENFPTVMICEGDAVRFFGTITPQPASLSRLVRSALAGDLASADANAGIETLARRVRTRCDLRDRGTAGGA